jgi:DNA-binding LacI/PurR family transcriptional regulator
VSRARLVDVAQLAGVSPKTVSNVVNGYVHVRPEMRARVQAAIDQLGYVPNTTARTLRTGRTGIIGLAVPNLGIPYFAELARHVTELAETHGFTILIDQTDGLESRERTIASGLRHHVIDGLIFSPLTMGTDAIAAAADRTPTVLLGEREAPPEMDRVAIDNVAAATAATRHLLQAGRRRIAAVGGPMGGRPGTDVLRLQGYRAALAEAGGAPDPALAVPTRRLVRLQGIAAAQHLLELPKPPDALFCFNDLLALGAIYALRMRGVRVPDDIAVVGFDDIEDGRYSTPTLTTISPDKERIARTAVDLLVGRLQGRRSDTSSDVVVDYELVVRESTGGAPTPLEPVPPIPGPTTR